MTTRQLHRPPRSVAPLTRPDPVTLAPPPPITSETGRTPVQFLLPVVGAMSSMVMMVVLRNGQPLFLIVAAVVFLVAIVAGIAVAISTRGQQRKQNRQRREFYLNYLEEFREEINSRTLVDRTVAQDAYPAPQSLAGICADPARIWDRRPRDPDFLTVRVGTGPVEWLGLSLDPAPPLEPYDRMLAASATRLVQQYQYLDEFPVTAKLSDSCVVTVIGDRIEATAAVRAMLLQLAVSHSPDDLIVAGAIPPEALGQWNGLDLLPHLQDARLFDGPVPARRIAPTMHDLAVVLGTELTDRFGHAQSRRQSVSGSPRLVVVCDDYGHPPSVFPLPPGATLASLNVTVIHILEKTMDEPSEVDLRITLGDTPTMTTHPGALEVREQPLHPDQAPESLFEAVARHLAPLRLSLTIGSGVDNGATAIGIDQLLGIAGVESIDSRMWKPRSPEEFLRVAFATDDLGGGVLLDLKESAQGGMGPHGICVGATGSGKSEMLRTLILALALSHAPEDLSMILVDYKGGAAFSPFASLPHLAGLIDNLADDPQLTTRARASIHGEVLRRQKLLKEADSVSITHYRQLRAEGSDLPPFPHLFIIIDEFGELLTAEPDFIDLFLQIGRIGRSIGVHLLLSSQRIEGGKLRGLDTYLSYRLGLRTFSEGESQTVLGTSDAFSLPSLPGYGYLKVDTTVYTRFRAGYVSGPVFAQPAALTAERSRPLLVPAYNHIALQVADDIVPGPITPRLTRIDTGPSLVSQAVTQLQNPDRSVRPIWLPPLPDRLALGHIVKQQSTTSLNVSLGLLDNPAMQSQDPWMLDLNRAGGHLAVIGAPKSGRTTFLRTLATSLALTNTPRTVAIYGMDLTGGGLSRIEGFPHVGGVATRTHQARLARLVEELTAMVATRETVFKDHAIESMTHLRTLHANGKLPKLPAADIVFLIDGYGQIRSDFPDLDEPVTQLITRGPGLGIHVVVGMTRWTELRMAQQPLFGTRIELRLGEAADSVIDRKLAAAITPDTPGRALVEGGLLAQTALPVLDMVDDDQLADQLDALVSKVALSWDGPSASPIRLLPTDIDPGDLPDEFDAPGAVPIGIRQDTMATEFWDLFEQDQHLIVLGDSKCGKSTLLRTIAKGLSARHGEEELAIAVFDTRGHASSALPDEIWAASSKTLQHARGTAMSIATELEKRPGMDPELRKRAPRIVVLVDDHDILSAGGIDPLDPLLNYLPGARDLDLHLVITRPVAGASRALYSPVLQTVRDTGGAVLLMSGDRSEGPVVGRTYPEQQPPGRGRYFRRGTPPFTLQTVHTPAVESGSGAGLNP